MLKKIFVIFLWASLLFLNACVDATEENKGNVNKTPEAIEKEVVAEKIVVAEKVLQESDFECIDMPPNAEILCFDEDKIVYSLQQDGAVNPEYPDRRICLYDLKKNHHIDLAKIEGASMILGSVAVDGEKIFLPYMFSENINKLVQIDTAEGNSTMIKEWEGDTFICNAYFAEKFLIIFRIELVGNEMTDYIIDLIDLTNNDEKNLVKQSYKEGSGTVISCIAVDSSEIYALTREYSKSQESVFIVAYDFSGKEISKAPYGLDEFEGISDIKLSVNGDTVFNIDSEKGFIIYNTINGRVAIQKKLDKGHMEMLELPEELHVNYPGGYKYLAYAGNNSSRAYFVNAYKEERTMYVFDYISQEFTCISFPFDNQYVKRYFRNEAGDIIVMCFNLNDNKSNYYFLNGEKIY